MNKLVAALDNWSNLTTTENGALTYKGSSSPLVDLYFMGGALRTAPEDRIISLFDAAMAENEDIAMRIAQWIRDREFGAGERRVWRVIILRVEERYPQYLPLVILRSIELGRWDDIMHFKLPETRWAACEMIARALRSGDRLCAKWVPRMSKKFVKLNGRGGALAREIRKHMGLSVKEYRKMLSSLSDTVEQKMCAREWEDIDFGKIPSIAGVRYKKAFYRHVPSLYSTFNRKVISGEATMNASVSYPHDVYRSLMNGAHRDAVQAHWQSLPEYLGDNSILPICDVSGSMFGGGNPSPIDVSVSLGLYLSERNRGPFKDYVMTFSDHPKLKKLSGDLMTRVGQITGMEWGMSTNLQAAFKCLLDFAVKSGASQEDLPKMLMVISDMEFNSAGRYTNADAARKMYAEAGYELPNVVWWNVQSRHNNSPVRHDQSGMALISGFNPAVVNALLKGDITPEKVMMNAVMTDRYAVFKV